MDKGDVSRTLCGLGLLPSSVCYFYMAEALRLSLREPEASAGHKARVSGRGALL